MRVPYPRTPPSVNTLVWSVVCRDMLVVWGVGGYVGSCGDVCGFVGVEVRRADIMLAVDEISVTRATVIP